MIRPRFRHTGRPCCLILLCLLLLPWLGACAPQYGVSVDSLRGPQADNAGTVYVPRPGVEGMAEDDLLFRDVAAQLEPCFTARGYTLKLDGQTQDKSDNLVFISFGISEPDVRIYTTVSYVPYTGPGAFSPYPLGARGRDADQGLFPCRAAAGRLHTGTGRRPRQEPLADRDPLYGTG